MKIDVSKEWFEAITKTDEGEVGAGRPHFLLSCPNCNSTDVEASGDDFDGMVNCNYCQLETYICYGTTTAIKVWNGRINTHLWQFGWCDDNKNITTYDI